MSASSSRVPLSPLLDGQGDAAVQAFDGGVLELEVELELLGHVLAHAHRVEPLQVGDAVEVQDPLDQRSACFISSIDSSRPCEARRW